MITNSRFTPTTRALGVMMLLLLLVVSWNHNHVVHASIGCPCVQDLVAFKFDLTLGCYSSQIVNPTDFQKTSCMVNDSNNARVKKVVIHDQGTVEQELEVLWMEDHNEDAVLSGGAYYYFQYRRSAASPSVLFMDLFTASNTLSASIDLYYATSNRNCVVSSTPIFWPDDPIFFLTVVRTVVAYQYRQMGSYRLSQVCSP
jgi:hypothetical protein